MNILVVARSLTDAENLVRMMVPTAQNEHMYHVHIHYEPLPKEAFDRAIIIMNPESGPKMEAWIKDVVAPAMVPGGELTALL